MDARRRIVLASTSAYRAQLLQRLRLAFVAVPPPLEEHILPGEAPKSAAERLAREKAESLRVQYEDAIIIAGDQTAAVENTILRKPFTFERALQQLVDIRGRYHTLNTALHVLDTRTGDARSHVDTATLTLRNDLTDAELRAYLLADRPFDCAGGYRIESLGIALFSQICCDDWSAIQGLPLIALSGILRELGVRIPA